MKYFHRIIVVRNRSMDLYNKKYSNFSLLFRSQIIEVIADIRNTRGGLSGLTVKEIIEIARSVVSRKFEHKMTNNQVCLQLSQDSCNVSS